MNSSNPLQDSLFLRVWNVGSSARSSSIRNFSAEGEGAALRRLVETGWVKAAILFDLKCPNCGRQYELVNRDSVLVCGNCGTHIDTRTEFRVERYTYEPSFQTLVTEIVSTLATAKICRGDDQFRPPPVEGFHYIGRFSSASDAQIEVFLAKGELKPRPLRELWGLALEMGFNGLVVCPGISEETERILSLVAASIPLLCVSADSLPQAETLVQIAGFPTFRADLSTRVSAFAQVLGGPAKSRGRLSPVVPDEIDELAKSGGRRFEAPALRLMMTIGVSEHVNAPGYLPDGLLLLPDGFWIVDVKSSEQGFAFDVSERDKAFRYISTVQAEYRTPLDGWTFYGEIVLTRTDPLQVNHLRSARDYFLSEGVRSTVVPSVSKGCGTSSNGLGTTRVTGTSMTLHRIRSSCCYWPAVP